MRRLGGPILLYALVAVLALAGPLAVSEEPPAPAESSTTPAEPAPAPAETTTTEATPAPAPAPAPEPAAPATEAAPAPAAPAPAAETPAATPAEQTVADDAPVDKPAKKKNKKVIARAAASTSVTISDYKFSPSGVTVNVGDTVTWNNAGPTPHSATADDGSFDTGILSKGGSGSHTFTQAGTFSYFCTPHPNMKGTVTVVAAAADDGDTGATGDTGSTGDTGAAGTTDDDGPDLPATGLDIGGVAVLGLATLALGAYLRRRTELEPARPAGRIGW